MSLFWLIPMCLVSYFIGNINFSVIFSNTFLKKDIRTMASGNPGASNMLRNFGFKWGLIILVLDAAKGTLPALLGFIIFDAGYADSYLYSHIGLYACGLAAVVGHVFPIIYRFRGGKGVATTMGVFFVANPLVSLFVFLGSILYLAVFEYSAICSFLFVTVMTIWMSIQYSNEEAISIAVYSLLVAFYFLTWYTHRTNIFRLLVGKENTSSIFKAIKRQNMKRKQTKWLNEMRNEVKSENEIKDEKRHG